MQLSMEFFNLTVEKSEKEADPIKSAKNTLEQYIKVCGLVEYKGFYMKIKNGVITIPEGISKANYLVLAREVYESRAAKISRTERRSKFFAAKNRLKSKK